MLRADQCLSLYYQPDEDAKAKLAVRQAFVIALEAVPGWAMHKAFDDWIRTGARRPSPAEIRILADRAIEPFTLELKNRAAIAARQAEPPPISDAELDRRREFAQGLLARVGFAKSVATGSTAPRSQDVTAEEIAETLAAVAVSARERDAEAARRASVAAELRAAFSRDLPDNAP